MEYYFDNVLRSTCILALLFVPADVVGVALYNLFYGADFALLCMSVFCAVILAMVGGFWFSYFDTKYARLLERYEQDVRELSKRK